jgi:hypothetical protein
MEILKNEDKNDVSPRVFHKQKRKENKTLQSKKKKENM